MPLATNLNPLAYKDISVPRSVKAPANIVADNSNCAARLNGNIRITPEARRYAAAELARRAGVPFSFFRTWNISWTKDKMVLEIPNGILKQVSFPYAPPRLLKDLSEGKISTARALWMCASSGTRPDLVVPFVEGEPTPRRPLFRLIDKDHVECEFDLPLAILLTLSRWEETLNLPHDVHGRFMASSSVAVRDGFLDRPIVDEYGLAFEDVMRALFPIWTPQKRELRVKLTMDADHVGIPFNWKSALRHTTHCLSPLDSGRNMLGWIPGVETPELRALREGVLLSKECNLDVSVYWKASPPGPRDSGYDPRDPRVRRVIDWLGGLGVESGVHPGYTTLRSPERLRREISVLREVLGDQPLGGRQHYLRWCPDTWIHWESCGLAYDSTVGYPEKIGFRAGTCIPYRPWLLSLNRQANLLEIPPIVMDRSLLGYMHLTAEEAQPLVMNYADRCRAVGGVFGVIWHNNTLLDPPYRSAYLNLLGACLGADSYDWRADNWEQA